jgi:hypothetical protein
VKNRRPINEDDILLTEMLIARSYGNLKQSVVQTSSDTLGSLGGSLEGTIRKHPYATAGAAAGVGILLFGIFRMMNRSGSSRGRTAGGRGQSSDMSREIISLILPMVTPYLTTYLEKYLGTMISKDRTRSG